MAPPMPPLCWATRGSITSPPASFVNVSDGTTESALSGPVSPTGLVVELSSAAISNDNIEETDEDLAQAIKQFLRIDDEGGDGGDSDEEGDECLIHTNGVNDTNSDSDKVEYSPEDDLGEVKSHVRWTRTGGGLQIGTINLENDESSVVPLDGFTIGDGNQEIKIPRVPKDYSPPEIDPSRSVPLFEAVDNPGK